MSKQRKQNLFSADVPFAEELKEAGVDRVAGGKSTMGISSYFGNKGWVCSLTRECQRICRRWW